MTMPKYAYRRDNGSYLGIVTDELDATGQTTITRYEKTSSVHASTVEISDDSPRYTVFQYDTYYPGGGSADEMGSYRTLEQALASIGTGRSYDYSEVLDLKEAHWVDVQHG